MFSGEPDGRSDVGGRYRLDDERREPGHHAVPDEHGVVPSLIPSTQNPTSDPRAQGIELLRCEVHPFSLESGDIDGARGHDPVSLPGLVARPSGPAIPLYTPNESKCMLAFGVCQEPQTSTGRT
jgi:hypothetical protein